MPRQTAKPGLPGKLMGYLERNLTTGSISFHSAIAIFIPLLVDQAILSVLGIFNSSMVSSSGEYAVSAVSMVDSLNMFLMNFFIAVATGATVVVAQYIGKRDRERAARTISQAILSSAAIALLLGVLVIVLSESIMQLLFGNAEPPVFANGRVYLIGSCISYPFYAALQTVLGSLRGMGDTRPSMVLSILANVLYLVGNFVLINLCGLGVLGLSISLVVSRAISAAASLVYLIKTRRDLHIRAKDFFRLDASLQKSILFIGLPTGTEQIFFNGGKILTQTFIVALGTASMTANAIANSITMLFYIPGNAAQLAAVTIVGQCVGAGSPSDGRSMLRNINKLTIYLQILFAVVFLPFSPLILKLYHASPQVEGVVMQLIFLIAAGIPLFWSRSFITPSGLRAAGDAVFTSAVALTTMWLGRVVMGYVFGLVLHWDIQGVILAMVLEWAVRGIIFGLRLRGEKWYRHKVIQ